MILNLVHFNFFLQMNNLESLSDNFSIPTACPSYYLLVIVTQPMDMAALICIHL